MNSLPLVQEIEPSKKVSIVSTRWPNLVCE